MQVGVYAVYEGQQPSAADAELQRLRSTLPALPPSLFGLNASCSCCRTAEQVVQKYGAVHGQRVKGEALYCAPCSTPAVLRPLHMERCSHSLQFNPLQLVPGAAVASQDARADASTQPATKKEGGCCYSHRTPS